ncbi:hypothetical protein [Pseudonocardia spinosispora]|uniref:hypothetical protein n=1 Tax=Pseudonocardia spinosispora TaxID=103441 RepID=UPI0012EC9FB7|nr:hypothetical protein [Pseudonocardia spinosispora]
MAHAKGLPRRAMRGLEESGQRKHRPGAVREESLLPVSPLLRPLFPGEGLRRVTVVRVRSSTPVVLAVMAEASATGTWSAVVGLPRLGIVAAAEAGLALGPSTDRRHGGAQPQRSEVLQIQKPQYRAQLRDPSLG